MGSGPARLQRHRRTPLYGFRSACFTTTSSYLPLHSLASITSESWAYSVQPCTTSASADDPCSARAAHRGRAQPRAGDVHLRPHRSATCHIDGAAPQQQTLRHRTTAGAGTMRLAVAVGGGVKTRPRLRVVRPATAGGGSGGGEVTQQRMTPTHRVMGAVLRRMR